MFNNKITNFSRNYSFSSGLNLVLVSNINIMKMRGSKNKEILSVFFNSLSINNINSVKEKNLNSSKKNKMLMFG